jgi:DNA-binding IscR family transcriptional regulator
VKRPQDIKLSEIVNILEGSLCIVDCLSNPESCTRYEYCAARDIWCELKDAVNDILESTTLQNLVERQKKKIRPKEPMYYI